MYVKTFKWTKRKLHLVAHYLYFMYLSRNVFLFLIFYRYLRISLLPNSAMYAETINEIDNFIVMMQYLFNTAINFYFHKMPYVIGKHSK